MPSSFWLPRSVRPVVGDEPPRSDCRPTLPDAPYPLALLEFEPRSKLLLLVERLLLDPLRGSPTLLEDEPLMPELPDRFEDDPLIPEFPERFDDEPLMPELPDWLLDDEPLMPESPVRFGELFSPSA